MDSSLYSLSCELNAMFPTDRPGAGIPAQNTQFPQTVLAWARLYRLQVRRLNQSYLIKTLHNCFVVNIVAHRPILYKLHPFKEGLFSIQGFPVH